MVVAVFADGTADAFPRYKSSKQQAKEEESSVMVGSNCCTSFYHLPFFKQHCCFC